MMPPEPFFEVTEVLKNTARSFYLSLMILPSSIKRQISVAYLFCKIADSIVDLNYFSHENKKRILTNFQKMLNGSLPLNEFLKMIEKERESKVEEPLFSALQPALTLFHEFSSDDQRNILEVVCHVILGMEIDLKGEAIQSEKELDQYCYYVAGSAGAFLTNLFYQHQFLKKGREEIIALGIQLGKGLQLTNIIRDRKEDKERNRFYLPPGANFSSDPVIFAKTLSYLENGLNFVLSVPRGSWRIRIASLWPVLFGLKTLSKVINSSSGDSPIKVKISRPEIYKIMLRSGLMIFSNAGIKRYFDSIKSTIRLDRGMQQ